MRQLNALHIPIEAGCPSRHERVVAEDAARLEQHQLQVVAMQSRFRRETTHEISEVVDADRHDLAHLATLALTAVRSVILRFEEWHRMGDAGLETGGDVGEQSVSCL